MSRRVQELREAARAELLDEAERARQLKRLTIIVDLIAEDLCAFTDGGVSLTAAIIEDLFGPGCAKKARIEILRLTDVAAKWIEILGPGFEQSIKVKEQEAEAHMTIPLSCRTGDCDCTKRID